MVIEKFPLYPLDSKFVFKNIVIKLRYCIMMKKYYYFRSLKFLITTNFSYVFSYLFNNYFNYFLI